ncbi:MAG TPA: hypothetical protein VN778_04415 [Verrucomicrobiae bacterium]|nr:hypothetical protein [Verrucomicrobiae bacterium]
MSTEGRPTVITNDTVRKLEDAFKAGFSVSEACLTAGISRATYYEHRASNEAFSDKMELAKKYISIRAKKVVVQAIDDGNFNAAKWWLEHRERDQFGQNTIDEDAQWAAHEASGSGGDELKQILDELKRCADLAITGAAAT